MTRPAGNLSRNVPRPSTVFTGREIELASLEEAVRTLRLKTGPRVIVLEGMGGIGKTQIAARYVDDHKSEYKFVGWVVGEPAARYVADLASLAREVEPALPESPDQRTTAESVLDWFSKNEDWLLVIDNLNRWRDVREDLRNLRSGLILITTRDSLPRNAAISIRVNELEPEAGATLLMRRAGALGPLQTLNAASKSDRDKAIEVSVMLGGLALALDQAGAYMQARHLMPSEFIEHYEARRSEILNQNDDNPDHPSVQVTYSLALEELERIESIGPGAADLVRMCAFLAPEAIPHRIFLSSVDSLPATIQLFTSDSVAFSDLWNAGCRMSILRRHAKSPALAMHRVTQEVVRFSLSAPKANDIVLSVVHSVSAAFPRVTYQDWSMCETIIPHAVRCASHITTYQVHTEEAAKLLTEAAEYLHQRARFSDAEPLLKQAIQLGSSLYGAQSDFVADAVKGLARLYMDVGRFDEAEDLNKGALLAVGEVHGTRSLRYANFLGTLARSYWASERHSKAEELFIQALTIAEESKGVNDIELLFHQSNLGYLYFMMGRLDEAEPHLARARSLSLAAQGETHPDYGHHLHNLGALFMEQGRLSEAEPLFWTALETHKLAHPAGHPDTAFCLYWLGALYDSSKEYAKAVRCRYRAWEIYNRLLGADHPQTKLCRQWLDKVDQQDLSTALEDQVAIGDDRANAPDDESDLQADPGSDPAAALRSWLSRIPHGPKAARDYERFVLEALTFIFHPHLVRGEAQAETMLGTERRDMTFMNNSKDPFWDFVRLEYKSMSIVVEAKNTKELEIDHINQVAQYLGERMGRFGFIVTRYPPRKARYRKLSIVFNDDKKVILVLTDDDIAALLDIRSNDRDPTLYVYTHYRRFTEMLE